MSDGQAKGVNICKRRDAAGTVDEVVARQKRVQEGDHPLGGAKYGGLLNASVPCQTTRSRSDACLLRLGQNET